MKRLNNNIDNNINKPFGLLIEAKEKKAQAEKLKKCSNFVKQVVEASSK